MSSSRQASLRGRGNRHTYSPGDHNVFPGDPRYEPFTLTAPASELSKLATTQFLSTDVLDCILQSSAAECAVGGMPPPMIASLGSLHFMASKNETASLTNDQFKAQFGNMLDWNTHRAKMTKFRRKICGFLDTSATMSRPQRLILPVIKHDHFFVACFGFSVHNPNFFVAISFYDSLSRGRKRIKQQDTAAGIVKVVNTFFNTFVLDERKNKSLQQSDENVIGIVQYH